MTHRSIHDGADLAREYTYDQCGRLLSDANRGIASIHWNENDRPQSIVLDNGMHIDYAYSASGEKLREQFVEKKKVPGFTWMMSTASALSLPIGGSIIISPRDSITIDHVTEERLWINGFEIVGDSVARINTARGYWAGGVFHRYALDWQGNVGAVIAQNGAVEQRTLYYPYGAPYRSDSPEANPYKFSGKQLELRQGLNMAFHGSRLYFADLGRFASPDIFSDRFNWLSPWTYCAANPLNLTDPSGNVFISSEDDIAAFINYIKKQIALYNNIKNLYSGFDIVSSNDYKKQIEEASIAIEHLEKCLSQVESLQGEEQKYEWDRNPKVDEHKIINKDGVIIIQGSSFATFAHELIHMMQYPPSVREFNDKGELVHGDKGREYEVEAYKTQFAADSEDMPSKVKTPERITDINDKYIKKLSKKYKNSYQFKDDKKRKKKKS